MLVKRSQKNQIAIPKAIIQEAGLGPEDLYFEVGCKNGYIILKPMQVEEKIPAAAYERLLKKYGRRGKGDKVFVNAEAAIRYLRGGR